ncbi:MAG: MmpS family transport accessory protein [Segniliparus sp.]|uniref:MmpS family transport accessory protein n=1 Tax=Segniliparus sp. TaxID=2804064 RepID=UPI003F3C324B
MRLHGVFGSDHKYANGGPLLEEPRNLHPKHVRYEVFGPAGSTVAINYMDENADAKGAHVTSLPWSVEFTMTPLTSALNVMAQGDSAVLGCRIYVNDELKDEYVARLPFAQTYCEVRNA